MGTPADHYYDTDDPADSAAAATEHLELKEPSQPDEDFHLDRLLHEYLLDLCATNSNLVTASARSDTNIDIGKPTDTSDDAASTSPLPRQPKDPTEAVSDLLAAMTMDAKEECTSDTPTPRISVDILRAQTSFAGMSVDAVIDTGSTVSFISRTFLNQLRAKRRGHVHLGRAARPLRVKLGDSTSTIVNEVLRYTFAIGARSVTHTFYVMEHLPASVLLGVDFMKRQNVVIDFGRAQMHLRGASTVVPITTSSGRTTAMPIDLYTDQNVIIPARSMLMLRASTWTPARTRLRVHGTLDCDDSIPSPHRYHLHNGLVTATNGTVVVPVVNYSSQPSCIPANTLIARATVALQGTTSELPEEQLEFKTLEEVERHIFERYGPIHPERFEAIVSPALRAAAAALRVSTKPPVTITSPAIAASTTPASAPSTTSASTSCPRATTPEAPAEQQGEDNGEAPPLEPVPPPPPSRPFAHPNVDLSQLPEGVNLGSCAHLSSDETQLLVDLIVRYKDVFSSKTGRPSTTSFAMHDIDTGDSPPVHAPLYRTPPAHRAEISKQTTSMSANTTIERSNSPWCSPVILAPKKDGTWRFCIDYRRLNAVTRRDVYPLPRIDDYLASLGGNRYFTVLDLAAGYWQVPLSERAKPKTAFATHEGLFQFNVMPFGLTNAPATFQRMMDATLAGIKWQCCLVYLDDIIVYSKTFSDHLAHLEAVLQRLRDAHLAIKGSKSKFADEECAYLGRIVTRHGTHMSPEKTKAVANFPTPSSAKKAMEFLGLAGHYRAFIPRLAAIEQPIRAAIKTYEQSKHWNWSRESDGAFGTIKHLLTSAPLLRHNDPSRPFIISTDASGGGLGAILSQIFDDGEHPIEYISRTLTADERKWSTTEQEALAVIWACESFRPYVLGTKFTIVTDHDALRWVLCSTKPGRLQRWSLRLQEFDYVVQHRKGALSQAPDALSRNPIEHQHAVEDDDMHDYPYGQPVHPAHESKRAEVAATPSMPTASASTTTAYAGANEHRGSIDPVTKRYEMTSYISSQNEMTSFTQTTTSSSMLHGKQWEGKSRPTDHWLTRR